MSITDEARLDAIDRRGRAAARTLLDDLAEHAAAADGASPTEAAPIPPTSPIPPSSPIPAIPAIPAGPATEPPALPDPAVIHLDRSVIRKPGLPTRPWLLGAAVVAIVATVAGAVALRGDGRPDVSSSGEAEHVLPGWLPAGFAPVRTIDVPDPAAVGFRADVAVYGDPDADDPWSATLSVTHLVADEELIGGPPAGGRAVTVAGHDARLHEGYADGDGWEVEWQVDDGRLIVGGPLTSDEVLAAAEAATTEPAIDSSGLPEGYAELAHGPTQDSLLFTSLFEGNVGGPAGGAVDSSGLAVAYADPSDTDFVRTAIVVAQRPGPASAVDLLRLSFPDADATTVRGHHAVVGRDSEPPGSAGEAGVVAVQWAETDGRLVTVVGFGVAEDAVLQVAEDMRPASSGEVAALRDDHTVAAPREFDDVPSGHVVAATGESQTGQWRIVANARHGDNIGSLSLERMWGAIASTVGTTGDRAELPLDLGADFSDGVAVVWGVLSVDAATVTVEAPGVEPAPLGIHQVEGWDLRVVAGTFPLDRFTAADDAVVIARDATGQEIARNDDALASG